MSHLATFVVGPHRFGVDVSLVREVVRLPSITPVPLAAPQVAGLVNLRGEVLTVIDVHARTGTTRSAATRDPLHLVVRVDAEPVSLLVDEIGAVLDVSRVPFAQTPRTVPEPVRELLLGAYTCPDRLLLALDTWRLLALTEDPRTP